MAALITKSDAKQRLHIDFDDEDTTVTSMLAEATDIVVGYLKKPNHGWTETTVPPRVKSAIFLVFAALFDGRSADEEVLSSSVRALLHRDRDPALA